MSSWSATPLPETLGITEGMRVGIDDPPDGFLGLTLLPLPADVTLATRIAGNMDVVIGFYHQRKDLESRLPVLIRRIPEDGAIWLAWPKATSGWPTDVTEEVVREVAAGTDLVPDRTCDVDHTWSGLRFALP